MTPNILEGMKKPFGIDKPTDFMWFDLGDHNTLSNEEYDALAHIDRPFSADPKDLYMPFERMAFVRKNDDACLVATIKRVPDNKLEAVLRSSSGDIMRLTHNPSKTDRPIDLNLTASALEFAKEEGMETNGDVLTFHWVAMLQDLYLACLQPSVLHKETIRAYEARPAANNEKRIRKGKRPLFEWKVIEVTATVVQDTAPTGRTHASPRLHSRRGHFRTYASGKRVWVRQTMVGRIEFGYIHHSYNLKGEAHEHQGSSSSRPGTMELPTGSA